LDPTPSTPTQVVCIKKIETPIMLTLKLFGRPTLTLDDHINPKAFSQKALALVTYLAITRQPSSREALAGLLWSDVDEESARRNLRVELSKLRPHLQSHLDIQRRSVAFDSMGEAAIDVVTFEENLNRPGATLTQLETAIALYSGDFLADFNLRGAELFEDWQLAQRERFHQMALDGLHKLVNGHTQSKQYEAGITAVRRLLALEPWLEKGHRQLMRLLVLNGQRSAALAQYEICRRVLNEELGVEPASETADLHLQILNDEIGMDEPSSMAIALPSVAIAPPFQAPQVTQYFVGRQAEIDQLTRQISGKVGLIGLVGMGGIGKTTLATRLAHGLKDDFPDGVLWADAANSEPLDILGSWATAFGYDFSGLGDVNNRAAAVRGMLAEKRCLIVLDDVAQVSRIRPLLAGGERCATLLTTRNPDVANGLEAAILQVGELPSDDGVALLADILGDERVTAEPEAAAEICALLQNLPLALEIVAKRLKSRQRRKLADMAHRLADMQNRLGLEISDHAVRASFEVSWSALDGTLKQTFALLATFNGLPFTAEALAAVAHIDTYVAEDALYSLVALSLLKEEADEAYKQHPLLADFAGEKLAQDGEKESAAFERMSVFYQAFAEENKADYVALRPWWGNFSAGIRVANRQENWPLLLAYVKSLDEPWFRQARFYEMRAGLALALEAAKILQDETAFAQTLLRLGEIEMEQNDYGAAENHLQHAMTQFMRLEDSLGIANSKFFLGRIKSENAQFDEAISLLEDSRQIFDEIGNDEGVAQNLNYIAGCWIRKSRDVEVAEKYLILAEQRNNQISSSIYTETLRFLARVNVQKEKLAEAEAFLERATAISRTLDHSVESSAILFERMELYKRMGQFDLALKLGHLCLDDFKRIGSLRWEGLIKTQLGLLYQLKNDMEQAKDLLIDSLKIFEEIGEKYEQAWVQYYLFKLYDVTDDSFLMEKAKQTARTLSIELGETLLQELIA
jgi:DNA-binding SARP family transcriptional activator/predicted ATPase/tetratricopeptide (TPR) repeat protein